MDNELMIDIHNLTKVYKMLYEVLGCHSKESQS